MENYDTGAEILGALFLLGVALMVCQIIYDWLAPPKKPTLPAKPSAE